MFEVGDRIRFFEKPCNDNYFSNFSPDREYEIAAKVDWYDYLLFSEDCLELKLGHDGMYGIEREKLGLPICDYGYWWVRKSILTRYAILVNEIVDLEEFM